MSNVFTKEFGVAFETDDDESTGLLVFRAPFVGLLVVTIEAAEAAAATVCAAEFEAPANDEADEK